MLFATLLVGVAEVSTASEGVILLHGLCRTDSSMTIMASALESAGYVVLNVHYPSRKATVETLAETVITEALADPKLATVTNIHFVTHSLGGILVRQYLKSNDLARLGRVVMLGPPNQGSEIVDKLGDWVLFEKINGPSGNQLGTGTNALPARLGAVEFELGVIAGDRSINWINSLTMITGCDDGKVSVHRTKIAGMKDHIVIHSAHPFIMRNKQAISETVCFLRTGTFRASERQK
jgi:esterase/lipase